MSGITMLSLVLGVLLVAAILAIVFLRLKVGRLGRQIAEFPQREAALRSDARKRSRIVHLASISEQLAPLLPGFRYNPKDVQWIGGGGAIDAIVWNGLEAGGDVEIVFLDVKAGPRARLTSNQRRIREAIAWKRIAFDEYRPPETPPLIDARPPELSDDEAGLWPGDQAEEETGPEAGACEVIVHDAGDVPVPFMGELTADEEPGS
jgi:predicted Holliday junction resolvase-like endonuclease